MSRADADLIQRFRAVLDAHGYTEEAIQGVLRHPAGEADPAADVYRLAGAGPLGTLVGLLLLGAAMPEREARRAFAPVPLERLRTSGLLAVRSGVARARVRLLPYDGLIVACDRVPAVRTRLPRDVVDGVTSPARVLAALTVRRPIAAALDVGTGGGLHALLAARHSRRVVGVDVNARALRYAAFNARLNGLDNVEYRQGSLFAPVEGERFDLVVANPPYVISPESTLVYRDSGRAGDGFCRDLVRSVPRFLAEGGWAVMLVNWIHGANESWWQPLQQWIEGEGCDVWLLRYRSEDPVDYAAAWNGHLPAARYAHAVDRWVGYYRKLGIEAIGGGAILMRRRAAPRSWLRADDFPNELTESAGGQILRMAATHDFLATLDGYEALLDQRFVLVRAHRLQQTVTSDGTADAAVLRLDAPLSFAAEVPAVALELLRRMNGARRLGEAIADAAQAAGVPTATLRATALPVVRQLLRSGLLEPVPR